MHICPWWAGYFIDNPIRRWLIDPERLLRLYVRPGMTVLDAGCGMGVNSLAMARLVGPEGQVFSVDVQPRMLKVLEGRAARAGLGGRIRTCLAQPDSLGFAGRVDFAIASWVVHETPDESRFLSQICGCLRPGGRFLILEPRGHVTEENFARTIEIARRAGLGEVERIRVRFSYAVLLERS